MLERSDDAQVAGIAEIMNRYSPALELLGWCDLGTLTTPHGTEPAVQLDCEVAGAVVDEVGRQFPKDEMFGIERGTVASRLHRIRQDLLVAMKRSGKDLSP